MALNGQNIKFLQGTSTALNNLTKSEVGAFYVTNDTHELFLGVDAEKKPVALNRWVDVVSKVEEIVANDAYKKPGKLYYATSENILCTWDAAQSKWVQINVDTNDNTSTADISFSSAPEAVTGTDGKVTGYKYTLTLQQQDKSGNTTNFEALTADFTITNDMVTNLVVDVAVGLTASTTNGKATIKTTGTGVDDTKVVTLTGNNGITIEKGDSDNDIKIIGTTYNLNSPATGTAQVVLSNQDGTSAGSVAFEGDTWIAPAANGEGKIKIEHTGPGAAIDYTVTDATGVTIGATDRKFTALTGIQKDAKGHIVGVTQTEFTVPDSNYKLQSSEGTVTIGEGEAAQTAKYTTEVQLATQDGTKVSGTEVKTAHTITVDGTKKIITNGGDFGEFYSSAEIDRILRVTNALTYKGTVDSADELPNTSVSLGDTYKVSTAFGNYQVGDLLIANGAKEDDNGHIEGTITWDHIAVGEDTDTQYKIGGADDEIQLIYANGTNKDAVASRFYVADDAKHISATVADNTLTVSHTTKDFTNQEKGDKTDTKTAVASGTVDVVTAIRKDDAGHIDGVTTTTITLPGADKVVLTEDNFTITDAANNTKGNLNFTDGNKTVANTTVDEENKTLIVKFDHATQTVTESTVDKDKDINLSAETDADRTFSVLESVSYDDYGHITGYQAKDVTIGKQSTYNLTGPSVNENVVTQVMQRDGATAVGSINLASKTLKYKVDSTSGTPLTYIDMVWGSF